MTARESLTGPQLVFTTSRSLMGKDATPFHVVSMKHCPSFQRKRIQSLKFYFIDVAA